MSRRSRWYQMGDKLIIFCFALIRFFFFFSFLLLTKKFDETIRFLSIHFFMNTRLDSDLDFGHIIGYSMDAHTHTRVWKKITIPRASHGQSDVVDIHCSLLYFNGLGLGLGLLAYLSLLYITLPAAQPTTSLVL